MFFKREKTLSVIKEADISTVKEVDIAEKCRKYHRQFSGNEPGICGIIHLYGDGDTHESFSIAIGSEYTMFSKAGEKIEEIGYHAVSITLIRNRQDYYGNIFAVKETCLINKNDTVARFFESTEVGLNGIYPVYSDSIKEHSKPFSDTANLTHDILDAMNIPY